MSQEEKYNSRCRAYSAWHRRQSTRRFVGIELAQLLSMIDLDAALFVEYDDATKEPLILVETARDIGQSAKPSTVTRNLAKRCKPTVPAFVLLYTLASTRNPADSNWPDISGFRIRKIWPEPATEWRKLTPQEWAQKLVDLRKWSADQIDRFLVGESASKTCAAQTAYQFGIDDPAAEPPNAPATVQDIFGVNGDRH